MAGVTTSAGRAAARSAGMPCVGLLCGGISAAALTGAVAVYDDPAALLAGLGASPLGRVLP